MNLAAIIDDHPAEQVALISRGLETTYGELRRQVAGLRGGLVGLGLQPGDRLAVLCANNRYFVVSYLAGLSAGLVVVPLNPLSPAPELRAELNVVAARAVVVGPSARSAFGDIDPTAVPNLEFVIDCGQAENASHLLLDDLIASVPTPAVDRAPSELAVLMFTSGTAGLPKAAMLTHGNLTSNLEQARSSPGSLGRTDDVVLGVLPLFHIFGLNVILGATLRAGSRVVLVERFDPVSALETIRDRRVTILAGPPNMWASFAALADVDPDAFKSVRIAVSGAAALPQSVAEKIGEQFGVDIAQGYGLTETAPTVTSSVGAPRAGSIGRVAPGVELRLVDEDGDDVEVGDAGEIWVRGPNVFAGYWNDPEATALALTSDGWLRTGDVAMADDDGYLYLVDRIKDLIIVSGFNVFPAEVEDVLRHHPGVQGAAVIGVAHPHSGEAVKAYVVATPGVSIEEDDIIQYCQNHLVRYKCPSKVEFVAALPEGVVGKVVRRELRAS